MAERELQRILSLSKVIPVVTLSKAEDGIAIGEVLLSAGIPILEITLRSVHALRGIELIRSHLPNLCVGAGTVWRQSQVTDATRSGAHFLVSPGVTDALTAANYDWEVPILCGAQTISEVARLRERGHRAVKFFPAEYAGGVAMVNAIASVLPDVSLCPTGGLTAATARNYLGQNNVACVGGGWLIPEELVRQQNWRELARYVRAQADELTGLA